MSIDSKQGPLTAADLEAIWLSSVDDSYSDPLVQAGEGGGYEVYTQAYQQIARLSQAIDRSFQSVYIQPWSGQTDAPASGPQRATVELTLTRGGFLGRTLILKAGTTYVDEIQNDFGPGGSVPIDTGRRYCLLEDLYFLPGESGPLTVTAQAVKSGYGYNNPLPGSLTLIENPGTGLYNDIATLTEIAGTPPAFAPAVPPLLSFTLEAYDIVDMFVPSNVGQFVLFTGGANVGATALVTSFQNPVPAAHQGSAVQLLPLVTFQSFGSPLNKLVAGQPVQLLASSVLKATGVLVAAVWLDDGTWKYAVQIQQGIAAAFDTLQYGSGTLSIDVMFEPGFLVPETPSGSPLAGGASWRILDWALDWKVQCTNVSSPAGGALGMLDLIGRERNLPRNPGEGDDSYRDRLWNISDVVSPNAVRRSLYRALGALPWCYRETNNGLLPGFFYDRTDDPDGDFYDDDSLLWNINESFTGIFQVGDMCVYERQLVAGGAWLQQARGYCGGISDAGVFYMIRKDGPLGGFDVVTGDRIRDLVTGAICSPVSNIEDDWAIIRRWSVYLDYSDFRGWFAVEVPALSAGEFGFAYDDSFQGFYDLPAPYLNFYDGYPAGAAPIYQGVYKRVSDVIAGGVGFTLFLADGPCI